MEQIKSTVEEAMGRLYEKLRSADRICGTNSNAKRLPAPNPEWRQKVLGLDERHHPKIASLAASAERFAVACLRDIRDQGTAFAIAGQTGVGKTHVVERICRYVGSNQVEAWARGWWTGDHIPRPCVLRWPSVVAAKDDVWSDCMDEVRAARLVVLDDLGAEGDRYRNSESVVRLHMVFEHLRPAWKWILVTTNVPILQWKARWDQRIADRLMTFARIDLTSVPSYRINHPGVAR